MRTSPLSRAALPYLLFAALGLAACSAPTDSSDTAPLVLGTKTLETKAPETKAPENKTPDNKTPDNKTSNTAASPATIKISSGNGAITVKPAPASPAAAPATAVSITAEIRAATQERLDACRIVSQTDAGGTLNISIAWPGAGRQSSESASITVLMPTVGSAILRTDNGAITVEHATGTVSAHTSNGAINLVAPKGTVDVESSNGAITITDAAGPVKAETSNGRISLSFTSTAPGPCELQTSNGAISLTVGAGFTGWLDAATSSGSLRYSGLPPVSQKLTGKSGELNFGPASPSGGPGSAARSRVSTTNGSIEITRR